MSLGATNWTNLNRLARFNGWLAICVLIASVSAFATPTALNIVPTADVLPNGDSNIAAQLLAGAESGGYEYVNQFQTELGLGDVVEFGLDPGLGPNHDWLWNAKYKIYSESRSRPALAVGQFADTFGNGTSWYVTSYTRIGTTRFHLGGIRFSRSTRLMVGWDTLPNRPFTLQADYVSGPSNYATIGFVVNLRGGWSLTGAQMLSNSTGTADGYMAIVGWTGPVLKRHSSRRILGRGYRGGHRMIVLAHRGESHLAPENTLAAFNLAWEKGDEAVEIDVHLSKDDKIMVMHDAKTGRTAGTDLVIKDTDSTDLRKLDVGKFKGEQYAGEKIPFLSETLATIPPEGRMLIEVKCGPEILPYLKEVIDASGKVRQVAIISFSLDVVSQSKKLMPGIPHYWLQSMKKDPDTGEFLPYDQELIQIALDNHLDGLDLNYPAVTKELVEAAKAKGLAMWTWTVDDPAEAKHQMEMGVDGMATNRGEWIREQL